jgi:hypothetical protein
VVHAGDLRPISARGEVAEWNGTHWVTAAHELRFEDGRAVGLVSDTAGHVVELDRELPSGIILQDMRDLAFALLEADPVVGRSVEFTTFDPRSGKIDQERYDVLDETSVEIAGDSYDALRINVASGLDNESYLVRADRPRIFLQRVNDDGSEVESVTSLEILNRRSSRPR